MIDQLEHFVQQYPLEQDIIFVGDYVYHFSYDRKALLRLMDFFLVCVEQRKHLYILAGNHDWLQSEFVFAESQKILDRFARHGSGHLEFMTDVQLREIDGRQILFVPFMHLEDTVEIHSQYAHLADSKHKQEQQSARINSMLHAQVDDFCRQYPDTPLTVIHHRYIADTLLPGLQAKFNYKSPALSASWLQDERISMISGHIHHACSIHNYLCVGAVRATSPLEYNECQMAFVRSKDDTLVAFPLDIKQYYRLDLEHVKKVELLQLWQDALQSTQMNHFQSSKRTPTLAHTERMTQYHISLYSDQIGYDQLLEVVDPEIMHDASTVSILPIKTTTQLDIDLNLSKSKLQESIKDRKLLAREYIQQKYPDQRDIYQEQLQELGLL